MSQKHMKSPCCQGKIYQHGQRRYQCSLCKKTWRLRRKKKGRKSRRTNTKLVKRYLSNGSFNLHEHANRLSINVPALRQRMRKSLEIFLEQEQWLKVPKQGFLIAIADALIERIDKKYYTTYFVLLRAVNGKQAIILEPIIYPRYESKTDWQRVFRKIPGKARKRIVALVSDGKPGFINIAKAYGWLLQRCHFHLLAELYRFASLKRRSKNRELALELHKLVRLIITTTDKKELIISLDRISSFIKNPKVPERIKRRFLQGFCCHWQLYRTYLNYQELYLPTTINSCEALCGIVRKFLGQSRGLNTIKSFSKWIKALMLFHKKITCKGAKFPPK